jgi:hypothetical protein
MAGRVEASKPFGVELTAERQSLCKKVFFEATCGSLFPH